MYDKPSSFLKEALTGRPYHRDKHVLSDVSLTIPRGQVVGIIGRNGAGKSTLLKIISRTLAPSRGTVTVNGRVSAILELGTGFNANYSGRDNVILSSLMRGMSEEAVRRKFDSIVAFAGLEDVIDEPFHTYSSGMQARLAFAAAVSVDADILVIDEALAAGDIRFTTKSLGRIHEICKSGVTALFVSHQTYNVMQMCSRAIWIDGGRVRMDGPPIDVVRAYEYEMQVAIARDQGRMQPSVIPGPEDILGPARSPTDAPDAAASSSPSAAAESTLAVSSPIPERGQIGVVASSAEDTFKVVQEKDPESLGKPLSETTPTGVPEPQGDPAFEVTPLEARELQAESVIEPAPGPNQDPQRASATDTSPALFSVIEPVEDNAGRTTFQRVSSGEYRMLDIALVDAAGRRSEAFRFGEVLNVRVLYECMLPELPEYSCGVAVTFSRPGDSEAVMFFNTNHPDGNEEFSRHSEMDHRQPVGRRGVIEATIDPIQLGPGEYDVSFSLLPNQPGIHKLYESIRCLCRVTILSNGFSEPSVFYPIVTWTNGPAD
jgi:ABC-type polysaccharide/polyol phosphate transport system ATPase subunit